MPRILQRLDCKVLIILLGVASTFIALSYFVLNHVVLPAFEALEEQDAGEDLERVRRAIATELTYLGNIASDWAYWDHTYEYLEGRRDTYEAENLVDSTYQALKIDFIYLYDRAGRLRWGRAIDREGADITLGTFAGDRLPLGHPLFSSDDSDLGLAGVLTTERGPYLVAARPLIGSQRNRPSVGTLVFGRALDEDATAAIGEQTRVRFSAWAANQPHPYGEVIDRLAGAPGSAVIRTAPPPADEIWSFGTLPDLEGRPALLLRAETARTVTAVGVRVVDLSMILMILAAALDMTVIGILLHRMVVRPIERLKAQVERSGPLEARAPLGWTRQDEIGVLARSFDRLQSDVGRHTAEMARAMEHVVAAGQAKASFLASMSHELRTPLNAIIGFSDVMKRELFGAMPNGRYREYAEDINTSGGHLLALVNKVLDMSKAESGHLELSEEAVDLDEITANAMRMVAPQATEAGVTVERRIDPALPQLVGDRLRLTEVVLNLLSNAVKFTDAGGRITLAAWCVAGGKFVLQVEDTGVGMAEEDIPRALAPFVQLDNNRGRHQSGTGLGLPLAKKMTEAHDGRLTIASRLGQGTTVTLHFPPGRVVRAKLRA